MKPIKQKIVKAKRAVSNTISTIILTGILFTVLVAAMFVATGILGAQLTSTEFNQAQSNMLLLDSTIQDTSLRPGAGGYVQFNEREGGIGLATTTTYSNLVEFVYSGGTQASAAVDPAVGYASLRGSPASYVNLTGSLGFARLEQDNGGKIKLDYDRVRIAQAGLIDSQTNLIQITFIHLVKGDIAAGTGTVRVNVQNIKTQTTTWSFTSPTVTVTIKHTGDPTQTWPPAGYTPPSGTTKTVVVLSEIQMEVSLR